MQCCKICVANMGSFLSEKYNYLLEDMADPRVKNWTGVESPIPVLLIIAFYLFSVYILLPAYMKNRKSYKLKTVLYYYNIFQIVSCALLIYGIATSGWTTTYSWACQPVDYSNNPEAIRMINWVYFCFLLKGVELIETVLFILRKKFNQVSKLHVYHHASTFFLMWVCVKFVGGGMATFPIMVNSFIHVLMYTYYLLASLGKKWQTRINKWKPTLTILQMVQFCVIIVHSLQSLNPECPAPKQLLLIYIPNVLLVFRMFWLFYQDSYNKQEKIK